MLVKINRKPSIKIALIN